MKFVTDGMLGKLTRWLRIVGKDVVSINDYSFNPEEEDGVLIRIASEESRCLLTRDIDLYRRALREKVKAVLIENEGDIPKQFSEISKSIGESFDADLEKSRCPVCNGNLNGVDKSQISQEVPEGVLENNDRFWRCANCNKIYWPGTHWRKITATVKKYFNLG